MPTVVWPGGTAPEDLPDYPALGFSEVTEPNVVSTPMQSGPVKLRRRSTLQRRIQTTGIELSGTQLETFRQFWANINHGVDRFEWDDMTTGLTAEFRFVPGQYPQWQHIVPAPSPANRRYQAVLVLEVLTPWVPA